MEKMLYRLPEVARMLSLGEKTVRMMLKRGDLPCVKQGKLLCVRADDLSLYVESLKPEGPPGRG